MNQMDAFSEERRIELHNKFKSDIHSLITNFDDETKLVIFRDVMIDQIYSIIDKFPLHTRKEMLAIMTDKYLNEWKK